jgi:predicted nucleic acid-binding protein
MSTGLLDTAPLVAVLDRADRHHAWAKDTLDAFEAPLLTCEAVVSEAWFLLGRARGGRRALVAVLGEGHLRVVAGLSTEQARIATLLKKYEDQPLSVADAALVRMAEMNPKATIITLDRDFLVYRRGRSALHLAPLP